MNLTANLTIGRKITLCLGLILVLLGIVAVVSYTSLTQVVNQYEDLSDRVHVAMEQGRRLKADLVTQEVAVLGYVIAQDDEYRQEFEKKRVEADEALSILRTLVKDAEARVLLDNVEASMQAYQAAALPIFESDVVNDQNALLSAGEVLAQHRAKLSTSVDEFIARETALVEAASADAQRQASQAKAVVVTASILAILIGAIIAILLSRNITTPINSI